MEHCNRSWQTKRERHQCCCHGHTSCLSSPSTHSSLARHVRSRKRANSFSHPSLSENPREQVNYGDSKLISPHPSAFVPSQRFPKNLPEAATHFSRSRVWWRFLCFHGAHLAVTLQLSWSSLVTKHRYGLFTLSGCLTNSSPRCKCKAIVLLPRVCIALVCHFCH